MSTPIKKAIRIETDRVQKIIKIMDDALKKAKINCTIYELFIACYVIQRDFERYVAMQKQQAMRRK